MLRASVIFSLFALQILPLVAQEKIDSVCVFRFCLRRDMFFVPYKSNEPQLEYLLAFCRTAQRRNSQSTYVSYRKWIL